MLSLPDFRYKQTAIHISGGSRERLRFKADNIVIEDEDGKIIFQHSCHRLLALFIIGETTLTTPAIHHAVNFGFPIIIMNRNMKVVARINSGAEGNTLLRQKQYTLDSGRRLEISKALIRLKINNQASLLSQLRYLSADDRKIRDELLQSNVSLAKDSAELLGMEGNASKKFSALIFVLCNGRGGNRVAGRISTIFCWTSAILTCLILWRACSAFMVLIFIAECIILFFIKENLLSVIWLSRFVVL